MASLDLRLLFRRDSWRWWVCVLLLLATAVNYMDRMTINLLATDISAHLGLSKTDYGDIEMGFALAFAGGSILFGLIVDRWNVYWVYPLAVLAWSVAGVLSGFAVDFWSMLACRVALGLAEGANWPCALRTTQRILSPGERPAGNSILQSGASVGAVVLPLVLLLLFNKDQADGWRMPFILVGVGGMVWVFAWWAVVRPADLALHSDGSPVGAPVRPALPRATFLSRFGVLIVLVVTINMTWHFIRVWGPRFLEEQHGFTKDQVFRFFMAYYIATDIGALTAGFVTLFLIRRGGLVHSSRRLVFLGCALLAALCLVVPLLPTGWLVAGVLLVIGFGTLGLFPNYYSFTQDLTTRHQGKVTGTLGACCWVAMAGWQGTLGRVFDATGSYAAGFIVAGLTPLVGFLALLLLWGPVETEVKVEEKPDLPAPGTAVALDEERIALPGAVQGAGG